MPKLPSRLRGKRIAREHAVAIERPEQFSLDDIGSIHPEIERLFDPRRNGDRANTAVLAAEVNQHPTAIPLLHMVRFQCHQFGSPQSASDEDRQNRPVPNSFEHARVRRMQQRRRLLLR